MLLQKEDTSTAAVHTTREEFLDNMFHITHYWKAKAGAEGDMHVCTGVDHPNAFAR